VHSDKNKKILILGANPETIPLIEAANNMGLHTIVTDNNPDAAAKRFAGTALNIDGFAVSELANYVEAKKVDAVLVGVADRLINPYREICQLTNKPSYCSSLHAEVLTNKAVFNQWCSRFEISTIPSFDYDQLLAGASGGFLKFPILVKPVDGNSGKGMSVARTISELSESRDRAMTLSGSKRVLFERYMECDDLLLYYTFVNGQCLLSAMGDRHTHREQPGSAPICVGANYPSRHLSLYLERHHHDFLRLFTALEIENGVLLVSAFLDKGELFAYDPGFRFQGEGTNHHLQAINGIDQYKFLINHALGETVAITQLGWERIDPGFCGQFAATVWILLKTGTIGQLDGLEIIKKDPGVHRVLQRMDSGDTVFPEMVGTEAQVFARVYLKAPKIDFLKKAIGMIHETVAVYDTDGNSMLLPQTNRWWERLS
jgi:biotin carboxylase